MLRGPESAGLAWPVLAIDRATMNQQAVAGCRTVRGSSPVGRLGRRGIAAPFGEYEIVAEMRGVAQDPVAQLLGVAAI